LAQQDKKNTDEEFLENSLAGQSCLIAIEEILSADIKQEV